MSEDQQARLPVPLRLEKTLLSLGKWTKIVGVVQAVIAAGFVLFVGVAVLTTLPNIAAFVLSLATVVLWALTFRQALLLQSAGEHLRSTVEEREEAHNFLMLAFVRLRSVFFLEALAAAALTLRNLVAWAV